MKFTRITADPEQMGGVPCIRGVRIPVATVVGMVADGMTLTEILAAYPDLEHEDIAEALRYCGGTNTMRSTSAITGCKRRLTKKFSSAPATKTGSLSLPIPTLVLCWH